MNLGAAAIVLRPRALGEILDLACRLCCGAAFGLYLRLSAAVLLPCLALCIWLRYGLGWGPVAVWAVALVLGSLAQGVFTIAAGRVIFSEALTARRVLALFARRFFPYLGAHLLSRGAFAATSLVLFLPLPFVWARFFFLHEACLLEGAGATEALRRSGRFSTGGGASVFGVLFALLATQVGFVVAAEQLGDGLVSDVLQLGQPFGSLIQDHVTAYALLGFFLSVPYAATARFLQYIDARTRSDGWDIQLRFMAIAARETSDRRAAA